MNKLVDSVDNKKTGLTVELYHTGAMYGVKVYDYSSGTTRVNCKFQDRESADEFFIHQKERLV